MHLYDTVDDYDMGKMENKKSTRVVCLFNNGLNFSPYFL